jgi:hypothetical protein
MYLSITNGQFLNNPNLSKKTSKESLGPYFKRAFIISLNRAFSGTKIHLGGCTFSLFLAA